MCYDSRRKSATRWKLVEIKSIFAPLSTEWGFFITMKIIQELYQHYLATSKITTDSRGDVKESLFFALSGEKFNGNTFAKQALEKGARMAVIDDESYDEKNGDYFLVTNVLEALQNLALFHRESTKVTVIGITGSNGKTTTKELISKVLETEKEIIATQGNFNNHIGVPLTLLRITSKTQIAVVEMGANHQGEIAMLCSLSRPNIGIITNIGKAHLEGMGGFQGVIKAKNELYQYIKTNNGTALVNADDSLLMKLSEGMHRLTYGLEQGETSGILTQENPTLKLDINGPHQIHFKVNSKLYGRYNTSNILAAVAVGQYFRIKNKNISKAIESYIPVNSRSQKINTETNLLYLDAYNANPVSMHEAILCFFNANNSNPWFILGDMFELGDAAEEEHKTIVNLLSDLQAKQVILAGKNFLPFVHNTHFKGFESTEEVLNFIQSHPIRNAQILIKGSRGMKLEQLIPAL